MKVLRLCSVYEPCDETVVGRAGFDPIGGMQNHTANLTRELDRRGLAQTVVTSRLGGPTGRTPLGEHGEVVRVGLPMRRLRQAWAVAALPVVLPLIRHEPPDIVHVHQGEDLAALPLGLAAAGRARCPLVVTLHTSVGVSVPALSPKLALLHVVGGLIERGAIGRAEAVIALTATTAAKLRGVDVHVIPSGVSDADFPAPPSPLLTEMPGRRVVYVGRLAVQKDVPTLVRAFGRLRTDASLCIVGDGPDRPAVERAIAALPVALQRRVHLFGFRPHEDVAGILAAADILVLPSIYEEMGSVLTEAMAAGVPVVASRVGGIPDVVVDGVTGRLVPPRDAERFAAAIDEVLADPAQRSQMAGAARNRAASYSWRALAGQVLAVYSEAIARRCASASRTAVRSTV